MQQCGKIMLLLISTKANKTRDTKRLRLCLHTNPATSFFIEALEIP